jgi:hypothetical protein
MLLCWYAILETASRTIKDGAFLRVVEKDVQPAAIRDLYVNQFNMMMEDVEEIPKPSAQAFLGDSREFPSRLRLRPYDAIITSPPYPNRHDYTRIYSLELLLGDAVADNEALKSLRYRTLRSHVEARPAYTTADGYVPPKSLDQILGRIQASETYDERNINMLKGYFEDMHLVLREMYNHCTPGGKIALVVSDVRFSGIVVPVGETLLELAQGLGFVDSETWVLRYRGNTPQQLRTYTKERTIESVIMATKPR